MMVITIKNKITPADIAPINKLLDKPPIIDKNVAIILVIIIHVPVSQYAEVKGKNSFFVDKLQKYIPMFVVKAPTIAIE